MTLSSLIFQILYICKELKVTERAYGAYNSKTEDCLKSLQQLKIDLEENLSTVINFLREQTNLTKLQRRVLSTLVIAESITRDSMEQLIVNKVTDMLVLNTQYRF